MSAAAEWQELCFNARKDQVEPLEDWLFARGALSITLEDEADQPLLEPGPGETPLWDAVRLTALFSGSEDLLPLLDEIPPELCTQAPTVAVPVADREWTRVEQYIDRLRVGRGRPAGTNPQALTHLQGVKLIFPDAGPLAIRHGHGHCWCPGAQLGGYLTEKRSEVLMPGK